LPKAYGIQVHQCISAREKGLILAQVILQEHLNPGNPTPLTAGGAHTPNFGYSLALWGSILRQLPCSLGGLIFGPLPRRPGRLRVKVEGLTKVSGGRRGPGPASKPDFWAPPHPIPLFFRPVCSWLSSRPGSHAHLCRSKGSGPSGPRSQIGKVTERAGVARGLPGRRKELRRASQAAPAHHSAPGGSPGLQVRKRG
jgi:hypothetical protein